jgi:hypothetical protein
LRFGAAASLLVAAGALLLAPAVDAQSSTASDTTLIDPSGGGNGQGEGHTPIDICHAVEGEGETGNGYNFITVDDDATYGGHGDHEGDLIPAPNAQCLVTPPTDPTTPPTDPTTPPTDPTTPPTDPTTPPTDPTTTVPAVIPPTTGGSSSGGSGSTPAAGPTLAPMLGQLPDTGTATTPIAVIAGSLLLRGGLTLLVGRRATR